VLGVLILLASSLLIFGALVLPELINRSNIPAGVGEVASQEILAPYSITYESKVLTERARTQAAAAVPAVFLPADPSISRRQYETLNNICTTSPRYAKTATLTRNKK